MCVCCTQLVVAEVGDRLEVQMAAASDIHEAAVTTRIRCRIGGVAVVSSSSEWMLAGRCAAAGWLAGHQSALSCCRSRTNCLYETRRYRARPSLSLLDSLPIGATQLTCKCQWKYAAPPSEGRNSHRQQQTTEEEDREAGGRQQLEQHTLTWIAGQANWRCLRVEETGFT